ncbi:MAG: 4-phosphoerythronate dehydrogenase PdxB [Bacteroides sp.]|nr:4-phosphoerythronate dehydrogenase PdxB [Bacteroides sp.]
MKVVVDNKIPYIHEAIGRIADEVVYLPGSGIMPEAVRDADALVVRTRTRCDRALLEGSRVQFIATATIGYDHIDTRYCREAGIAWTNAPGCNSGSVAQYVESALLLLQREKGKRLERMTLGIVGVGNVGRKVAALAGRWGMNVLLCDPPRAEREGSEGFHTLEELCDACDLLTFHVPLVREGKTKTFHLADSTFFRRLKRHPILINTSRGEVVETQALLEALQTGRVEETIIDVWENEPHPNLSLLNKVYIGTPHIAGYSADGKANATRMSLDALCRHFHLEADYAITPPLPETVQVTAAGRAEALLEIYNPHRDSLALKQHPEAFERLRGDYPLRREPEAYRIVIG